MHSAMRVRALVMCGVVLLVAIVASARTRIVSGGTADTFALVYHYDQDHTQSYVSAVHPPASLRLTRFIFDVNTPGAGAGNIVFSIRRYYEGDGGYTSPICNLTVPCDALAAPGTGHIHSSDCDGETGPSIGSVLGELIVVEVLSSACSGSNNPEGNITLYFEE